MLKKVTRRTAAKKAAEGTANIILENNSLLPMLYGDQDAHLQLLEDSFNITLTSRGNIVALNGDPEAVKIVKTILVALYEQLERGRDVMRSDVEAAIRMAKPHTMHERSNNASSRKPISTDISVTTIKKTIAPYSHMQAGYIEALQKHDMVFALGPAGTGKTYIAVAQAVHMFINKRVDRIILSRPAVEAGEKLGFLPGDLKDKIDPYLRPLYDALYDMMPGERVVQHLLNGEIEVAPLAFMRGRTLSNAFIILDEAQNTTPTQMKMFLTRLGENSRMVITGDLTQTDLPRDISSGLRDAIRKVEGIEGIAVTRFSDADVVRHTLAAKIVHAYDEWDKKKKQGVPNDLLS